MKKIFLIAILAIASMCVMPESVRADNNEKINSENIIDISDEIEEMNDFDNYNYHKDNLTPALYNIKYELAQTKMSLIDKGLIPVTTMYAICETGIYAEPNETSYQYDTTKINTAFEVTASQNGWSEITTQDGFAYIKTECLSLNPKKTYSDHDLYLMAHLLAGEAQFCSNEEQRYVGSVALNRVNHASFPNTLEEVIFQRGQYACTRDGNFYREPTSANWANAQYLLENGSVLPANVIWQSGGKQGKGVYLKTKYHYYCY